MDFDIGSATLSDMSNNVDATIVNSMVTDGTTGQQETEYSNRNWTQQWGYFNQIPELKSALLMKAIWTVGKGYECDERTKVLLDHISGWGKDTFSDILFNMEVTKRIGGDAFAEIIRDSDGDVANLKPLDPSSIKIVVDSKGIIKKYKQVSKITNKEIEFSPEDILHFSHNRIADQIHGISDIDALAETILAEQESFTDTKRIMHQQAKPMIMFKLGTDKDAEISAFAAKMDKAVNKGENIYIPFDEKTISYDVVQVNPSQLVLAWRQDIKNKFYRAVGLPQIVFGSAGTTESGGKIEYLAHEQVFERDQREVEEQIWNQLQLKINLLPPTSLLESLQADQSKDANQGLEIQPSDLMAGKGK